MSCPSDCDEHDEELGHATELRGSSPSEEHDVGLEFRVVWKDGEKAFVQIILKSGDKEMAALFPPQLLAEVLRDLPGDVGLAYELSDRIS